MGKEREVGEETGGVGEAIEVPEMLLVAVSDPIQVDTMFKPKSRGVR